MKPLRIALVNAPPLGVIEPWYDAPDFPRSSLASLAAYMRQYNGYAIKVIDAKFDRLSFDQTIAQILLFKPDIVGFTAFTNEIKPCAYVAAKIKQANPNIYTLVGGAHFTALPDRTLLEFPSFDGGISGDGEESLLEFCKAFKDGKPYKGLLGLVYRENGQVIMNGARPRNLDVESLPMPAWDLFKPAKHYWMQTSWGCPFKCSFCMNHNGRVARNRSVEKTIAEMEYLIENYHPEWIRFGDELFTVDMQRTADLLDAMVERNIGHRVKWEIQTHVKYVNRELLKKFKAANVMQFDMGVESGDSEILKHMGKATNLDGIKSAFKMAHEEGIQTGSLLLVGQPNETVKTMLKTIDLAVQINSSIPMFGIMVPFPGTEVAKMAAKNEGGYSNLSNNWDEYRKQIGGSVEFAGISRTQIEVLQFWGYLKVFIWNLRFIDLFKFILKYKTEGLTVVRKIFKRSDTITDLFTLPDDYNKMLVSNYTITGDDFIYSKEQFDVIQRAEVKRASAIRPDLVKKQLPIKQLAATETTTEI